MIRRFWLLACALMLVAAPAGGVVTELSNNQIEIKYSFDGAELILFGAAGRSLMTTGDSFDVVVVVRGPSVPVTVRKKNRVGGIWMNDEAVQFPEAPGYYAVAASRPLEEIADTDTLTSAGILLGTNALRPSGGGDVNPSFLEALFRLKSGAGLYRQEKDTVRVIGEGLFRTNVHLPANVPVGNFAVDTFIFRDRIAQAADRITLTVDKGGFSRGAYDFAHQQPFLYGLTAVIIALLAGWIAGLVGRK